MTKTNALLQLLDELREDVTDSNAVTTPASKLKIIFDKSNVLEFNQAETELLLHSVHTVDQLFEALNEPVGCAVELHSVRVDDSVHDALERLFAAVDEV